MNDEDIKKYPDLYHYLKGHFPSLPKRKPKIFKVWLDVAVDGRANETGVGDDSFPRYVFEWGQGPNVSVNTYMMPTTCIPVTNPPTIQPDGSFIREQVIPWYGFTVPTKGKDEIYVAEDLAKGAMSQQINHVLEVTVLHELIHWCQREIGRDVYSEEAPYRFEKLAYGKTTLRSWAACKSLKYYAGRIEEVSN